MPIYPVICLNCGETSEILCKHQEVPAVTRKLVCEKCGGSSFKVQLAPFVSHFNYTKGKKDEKTTKSKL